MSKERVFDAIRSNIWSDLTAMEEGSFRFYRVDVDSPQQASVFVAVTYGGIEKENAEPELCRYQPLYARGNGRAVL